MNGEKNKELELQKFYDAEGNEITMLDTSIKNMTINQFKKLYTTNPDFRNAVGNSRYSEGLISAIKTDQGN